MLPILPLFLACLITKDDTAETCNGIDDDRDDAPDQVVQVAAGGLHSMALLADGTVWSWGSNASGALGNGTREAATRPVEVLDLSGVSSISAGYDHSVASAGGLAYGWGSGGATGDDTGMYSALPLEVEGITGVRVVAAGSGTSFALVDDGGLYAWGWNSRGALGDGTDDDHLSPVLVWGLSEVTSLSAGHGFTVAAKGSQAWAWGYNGQGELGDGTTTDRFTPAPVPYPE